MGSDDSCVYVPTGDVEPIPAKDTTYGTPVKAELHWSQDAEERMRRIPSFVRGVVIKRTEEYAKNHGHTRITLELLDEIRKGLPIDFSKKQPFFMKFGKKKDDA